MVFQKFADPNFQQLLFDTEDKYLVETNVWKDTYWGVDVKLGGDNNLGKMLMKIRLYWRFI